MKVVGEDHKAKQVDPNHALIEILTGDSGIADQEASSDDPVTDMGHSDLIRIKHFCSIQTNHPGSTQQNTPANPTPPLLPPQEEDSTPEKMLRP